MEHLANLITSIASLVWPLLFLVLILMFGPSLRDLISTLKQRRFNINVGGTQITVEEATEQQRRLISDLQEKVLQLEREAARDQRTRRSEDDEVRNIIASHRVRDSRDPADLPTRLLWVDDNPANNAQLAANLRERGIEVVIATNTKDAMSIYKRGGIEVVISDMRRQEDRDVVPDAGLKLIELIRAEDKDTPIYIFCSKPGASLHANAAKKAGANGITSSALTLLSWIGSPAVSRSTVR